MDPIGAIESKGHVGTLDTGHSNGVHWIQWNWLINYRFPKLECYSKILGILLKCGFIAPVGSWSLGDVLYKHGGKRGPKLGKFYNNEIFAIQL